MRNRFYIKSRDVASMRHSRRAFVNSANVSFVTIISRFDGYTRNLQFKFIIIHNHYASIMQMEIRVESLSNVFVRMSFAARGTLMQRKSKQKYVTSRRNIL